MKTAQEVSTQIDTLQESLAPDSSWVDHERVALLKDVLGSEANDMMSENGFIDYMNDVSDGKYIEDSELPADLIWDSALSLTQALVKELTTWVLNS